MFFGFTGYKLPALFLTISAFAYFAIALTGGFSFEHMTLIVPGVIYLLLGWQLSRGRRWLGYFVFLIMLGGSIMAYATGGSGMVAFFYNIIIIANILCALTLFRLLWKDSVQKI